MQHTQRQVLELAVKHRKNAAVSILLASIKEAQIHADDKHRQIESLLSVKQHAREFNNDAFVVTLHHSDLVTAAHDLSAAMTRIGYDIMALASVLQGLGEEIVY